MSLIHEMLPGALLSLTDCLWILSVVQADWFLTPRNLPRQTAWRVCEDRRSAMQQEGRCCLILEEECHKAHLRRGELQAVLLLASQPGPVQPFRCKWLVSTSTPVARARPWFYSSEVKQLLSQGQGAQLARAEQQAANAVCCKPGREEDLQEPQAGQTLTQVFLCMFLYLSYLQNKDWLLCKQGAVSKLLCVCMCVCV